MPFPVYEEKITANTNGGYYIPALPGKDLKIPTSAQFS